MAFKLSSGISANIEETVVHPKGVDFEDFCSLAQCFASIMEGDTHRIDHGFAILKKYGLDEYGYPSEDEEIDDTPIPPKKPKKAAD